MVRTDYTELCEACQNDFDSCSDYHEHVKFPEAVLNTTSTKDFHYRTVFIMMKNDMITWPELLWISGWTLYTYMIEHWLITFAKISTSFR